MPAAPTSTDTTKRKRKKSIAPNAAIKDVAIPEESKQQPVWHVVALNTLTLSAYSMFWFFKSWRDLKAEAIKLVEQNSNSDDASDHSEWNKLVDTSPLIRTIGIVIPGWQLYLFYSLFKSIALVSPLVENKKATMIATVLTVSLPILFALGALPGVWFFLYLLGVVPIAISQHQLNDYWRTREDSKKYLVRHAFTPGELIAIILGASVLGLCLAGFMLIPPTK